MEKYIESVRTLLGVLGHRLLDPLVDLHKPTVTEPLNFAVAGAAQSLDKKNMYRH